MDAGAFVASGVDMKRLAAAMLLGAALVGLTGCTEAEKNEAVEPVVRHVIESFLEPITVDDAGG